MRRRLLLLPLALLLLVPATPSAQRSSKGESFEPDRVRLLAIFRTRDLGEKAYLSGQFRHLDGPDAKTEPYADSRVILEEAPYPHTAWTPVAETITDQEGYFSFTRAPTLNTRYRVRTEAPPVMSKEPIVRVRLDAALELSRRRMKEDRLLELSGTVRPPHDGLSVLIQRRDDATGRYDTVSRTRLRLRPDGTATFSRRLRMRRPGRFLYRARVGGDADHLPGVSRSRKVVVVGKRGRG